MNFCKKCDNMYYMKIEDTLKYYCSNCGHEDNDINTENLLVSSYEKKLQVEFINGMLDTSGFCNSGGWLPRKGLTSEIRQRVYFQVVRNWKLTVEIDNFLRSEFDIPIAALSYSTTSFSNLNAIF